MCPGKQAQYWSHVSLVTKDKALAKRFCQSVQKQYYEGGKKKKDGNSKRFASHADEKKGFHWRCFPVNLEKHFETAFNTLSQGVLPAWKFGGWDLKSTKLICRQKNFFSSTTKLKCRKTKFLDHNAKLKYPKKPLRLIFEKKWNKNALCFIFSLKFSKLEMAIQK